MRRLVKENLLTFEGKRLFTQRFANTLNFELSEPENNLYEAVTRVREKRYEPGRSHARGGRQAARHHYWVRVGRPSAATGIVPCCHLPLAATPPRATAGASRGHASHRSGWHTDPGCRSTQGHKDLRPRRFSTLMTMTMTRSRRSKMRSSTQPRRRPQRKSSSSRSRILRDSSRLPTSFATPTRTPSGSNSAISSVIRDFDGLMAQPS